MDPVADDLRSTELESLEAIYPEIHRPLPDDPFTFEIELPVVPADPVTVTFPPPSRPVANSAALAQGAEQPAPDADSLRVSHLPSLLLRVTLPQGYPEDAPPKANVATSPEWLPSHILQKLQSDAPRLWEEVGRDMVAYTYIDHINRAADEVFGATNAEGILTIDPQHKLALLDYDIKAKKEAFERETFDCGVCLDPKRGSKCHKMLDCGHIFCLQCLQDFYNDAIQEGSLQTVRCLTPNCAKSRSAAISAAKSAARPKKPKTYISPSELLQIGLTEDTVKRYVALKYKTELETDKNTIYCPRSNCNGAARSERHKKPEGFELNDLSDAESDQVNENEESRGEIPEHPEQPKKTQRPYDPSELLAICEDCGFAFCGRCYQSWHGEFIYCRPKVDNGDISAEEKASLEYLHLHTSPCPTCGAPAQKTHGCNHMICSRCDTHFCYLCSAWLDPANPYRHYNTQPNGKVTSCFMRLWELEGGDGDDVGLGFVGGIIQRLDQAPPEAPEPVEPLEERAPEMNARHMVAPPPPQPEGPDQDPPLPRVAREAPLVLRIMDQRPRPQNLPAEQEPQPVAGRGRGQRGRGRRGRGQLPPPRGGGQRGRGGARRAPAILPDDRQRPAHRRAADNNPGDVIGPLLAANEPLDEEQQAWVRRFVEMALLDAEDEFDGDSDDDINFLIR